MIVVDFFLQCIQKGEIYYLFVGNIIRLDDIYVEIGEILFGVKFGCMSEDEIIIFDFIGMVIQDNIMVGLIYWNVFVNQVGIFFFFIE